MKDMKKLIVSTTTPTSLVSHSSRITNYPPTTQKMSIVDLPPELFPNVALHLPLCEAPSTLLALASTNSTFHELCLPLLYSHVILKNETHALSVLKALTTSPEKTRFVRGLHITSELSNEVRLSSTELDVVRAVERLIRTGYLSDLHTLELHLQGGEWYKRLDEELGEIIWYEGFGEFEAPFWESLKGFCPNLRNLSLKPVEASEDVSLHQTGLFNIRNITHLTLSFRHGSLDEEEVSHLRQCVERLSGGLRSLYLDPNSYEEMCFDPFLDMNFPYLESFTVGHWILGDLTKAMRFWERHSTLRDVCIGAYPGDAWFSDCSSMDVSGFLPALRRLKASFINVRNLAPILHRLISLEVSSSLNAQVPYLLREILPSGLPNLKSLLIEQASNYGGRFSEHEAVYWYETPNGEFKEAEKPKRLKQGFLKPMVDGYLHSIARGAPNIEELALEGRDMDMKNHHRILGDLSNFKRLKKIFVQYLPRDLDEDTKDRFASLARDTAEACPLLETFGNINRSLDQDSNYLVARISRAGDNEVKEVRLGLGNGLVVGQENCAFPLTSGGLSAY
ncbi:hypothetical protein CC2G_009693 [Coprinopsis cinerea AmutBmut pab1-1]|nr:hypothetical protein CC2G_009693 [Coprinopsis cinerea AmutBmut pab1-1]